MNPRADTDMIVENVLVPRALLARPDMFGGSEAGDCLRGDLVVRHGRVTSLRPSHNTNAPRMVLPKLVEPHVHLDKCHTVERLANVGGDLHAAIAEQWRDKQGWTEADVRARAGRGITELEASGCRAVRTHVDWSHGAEASAPPLSWHVLSELAQDAALDLQLSPLTGVEDLTVPGIADQIARAVVQTGGALGCFVHGQPDRTKGIEAAFRAADRHGVPLDFHVDEGLTPGLDGLELIADTAIRTGFDAPVLCGHACSLMNFEGDALHRLLEKMARARLTVAVLPTTNLYLQGRSQGTPDRRGITRIRELQAAGVTVVAGTDNVRDAFCPIGRHDPLASLALTVLGAHLDPPLGDHLPMITTEAARALGIAPVTIDGAALSDLLMVDCASTSDLLAGMAQPRPLENVTTGGTT